MKRGGWVEPRLTPRRPPSPARSMSFSFMIVTFRFSASAISVAAVASSAGVSSPPGVLTKSRANATPSATRAPKVRPSLHLLPPAADPHHALDVIGVAVRLVPVEAIERERCAIGEGAGQVGGEAASGHVSWSRLATVSRRRPARTRLAPARRMAVASSSADSPTPTAITSGPSSPGTTAIWSVLPSKP